MSKKHTSYTSAFAIGEMAVLSLDNFADCELPYGVVEGVLFYGPQVRYRLSLFVNDGPASSPKAYRHEGRPVDGFIADDLRAITNSQYVPHIGHVGMFERTDYSKIGHAEFKMGELVQINWSGLEIGFDPFNIPVMITGVRYEEGKVLYDVSIQRKHYEDGSIRIDTSTTYGRLVGDSLHSVDSIFLKPVGGWRNPITSGRLDSNAENKSNVPRSE